MTADPDPAPDRLGEAALSAAIDSIEQLGKAVPGDKTMLDALVPALEALRADATPGPAPVCPCAAAAATAGADATIPLVARKGRASYLGERSAGHRDPGAASSALLVALPRARLRGAPGLAACRVARHAAVTPRAAAHARHRARARARCGHEAARRMRPEVNSR